MEPGFRIAILSCRPVHNGARARPLVFNAPEIEGPGHNFELRTAVCARNNLAILDVVLLDIEFTLTFRAGELVPMPIACHVISPAGRKN